MSEFWRSAYENQADISALRMRFGGFIFSFFKMIRRFCVSSVCCRIRPFLPNKSTKFCWLALLLVRIAEVETGQTWPTIRRQMQQQNLVDLFGRNGRILQHTELTQNQRIILKKLNINPPKRILKADISA